MTQRLNREAFAALLDAHGADMRRWPVDVRMDAQALLLADAQAREMLAQARALEDLLRSDAAPPPADDLQKVILARALAMQGDKAAGCGVLARKEQGSGLSAGAEPDEERADTLNGESVADAGAGRMAWWMAASLAAAPLLGIWLGMAGMLAPLEDVMLDVFMADVSDDLAILLQVNGDEGQL